MGLDRLANGSKILRAVVRRRIRREIKSSTKFGTRPHKEKVPEPIGVIQI